MIKIKGIDPKMIANNLEPSAPIHPGEMIKEEKPATPPAPPADIQLLTEIRDLLKTQK